MANPQRQTNITELTVIERVPPHSVEAEQAVLAAMLVTKQAIERVLEVGLGAGHFYRKAHATIFLAAVALYQQGEPVDLIMLRDKLGSESKLEECGGYGYLVDLTGSIPTTEHARHYAELVKQKAQHRAAIGHHSEAIASHYAQEDSPQAIEDAFGRRQADLALARPDATAMDAAALQDLFWSDLEERVRLASSGQRNLLEFGYYDVDQHLGGMAPGDLLILGGRPAMGKTGLALNFFWNVAAYGRPHLYTLEMSKIQMMQRLACMLSGVEYHRLRSGNLRAGDRELLETAMVEMGARDFVIDDGAGLTMERLRRAVLRDVAAGQGPKLVVVDYIGLMEAGKAENRNLEVSALSRGLKNLAREANCVVMALSQLSRALEARTDKRPLMSDLRESGSLEQDADCVAFVYRDEYYNPETEKKGVVELIFGKWRHGSVGTVELYYDRTRQKFSDITGSMPGHTTPAEGWQMPTYDDEPDDTYNPGRLY